MIDAPVLQIKDLHTGYHKKEIVCGISFDIAAGEFACVIGANGCGKSTALKAILGLLPLFAGEILMSGSSVATMNTKTRAQHFAYIPQVHTPPFPFKVADVVLLGRTPHLNSTVSAVSKDDKIKAYTAMEQLDITDLAQTEYTELSGGQQQLVLIARALAQEPRILVMDEPTASLDYGNQQLVLSRMHDLSRSGMAVLMVTHDPDHALFVADQVIVMESGKVIDQGTPLEMITTRNLEKVYNTHVHVADVVIGEQMVRTCVPIMGQTIVKKHHSDHSEASNV
jgi:iron complex transport system ATP-binding protein